MTFVDIGTVANDGTGDSLRSFAGKTNSLYLDDIAALQALGAGDFVGMIAGVRGYYTDGDGGEGQFWHDSGDATSTDNGGTIIVDASGRRWKRLLFGRTITVCMFGAVSGGSATSNRQAIQAAIDYVASQGGGAVIVPSGRYAIDGTIYIDSDDVSLLGVGRKSIIQREGSWSGQTILVSADRTEHPTSWLGNICVRNLQLLSPSAMTADQHLLAVAVYRGDVTDMFIQNPYIGVEVRACAFFDLEGIHTQYVDAAYESLTPIARASYRFTRNGEGATNYTDGNNGNITVTKCHSTVNFGRHTTAPVEDSFLIEHCDGLWLTDCYARAASEANYRIRPPDEYGRATGVRMQQCWSDWAYVAALWIQGGASEVKNVRVKGLRVYGGTSTTLATQYGVILGDNTGNPVEDVHVMADTTNTRKAGIDIRTTARGAKAYDCKIRSAAFDGTTVGGITVQADTQDFEVVNNDVGYREDWTDTTSSKGITIAAGSSDNYIVAGNKTAGNAAYGVFDGGTGTNKVVANNL